MPRCNWPTLDKSELYQQYHDNEWSVPSHEDSYLFEMLLLESFHCGLSWLLILKKRDAFRAAFDGFDPNIIANYDEHKIQSLMENTGIVRNKLKILASVKNAKSFLLVQQEFGSFSRYIWSFTEDKVRYTKTDEFLASNDLSNAVAKDLKKHGFSFMGSVTTYSYLEAIGVMNNHASYCTHYPDNH